LRKFKFDRLFEPYEVDELIPRLEFLMRGLQENAQKFRKRFSELTQEQVSAPIQSFELDELIRMDPELHEFAQQMAEFASQIEACGGLLKDVDLGLVDFPAEIEGETVFLCWQFGEPRVSAWHPLDGGFSQRRPLQGVRRSYLN